MTTIEKKNFNNLKHNNMTNGNDFASPSTHQNFDGTHDFNVNKGLTKREYFAAMALQAVIQRKGMLDKKEDVAVTCVEYADALINALNETQ